MGAAEPRASGASALGSEGEGIGEDVCKVRVKRIGKGGYYRDRIGGEGEARGDGSAAMKMIYLNVPLTTATRSLSRGRSLGGHPPPVKEKQEKREISREISAKFY